MDDISAYPECETVVTSYKNDFCYCGYSFAQMRAVNLSPFAPLTDGELVAPGDLLFLDTETTGLSTGSGAVAFLLGVGHYSEDGFVIKQYLMRDYDEEASLLLHLKSEMANRNALVTYNGKAFDMNLLASRYIMNGMRLQGGGCHIDLLQPSRRIWRRCLENCRLSTIESQILGGRRTGDIPGSLIPQIYFDYLETREYELLDAIFLHNRLDILAMAAILKYIADLSDRVSQGAPYGSVHNDIAEKMTYGKLADRTSEELLGLAGFFYTIGDRGLAESCLHKCLERGKPAVDRRALRILAEMKKREGKHPEAVAYWKRLLDYSPAAGVYPYIELAKYYEHKERNPVTAKEYTDQAHIIAAGPLYNLSGVRMEIEQRRDRLIRKINRMAER